MGSLPRRAVPPVLDTLNMENGSSRVQPGSDCFARLQLMIDPTPEWSSVVEIVPEEPGSSGPQSVQWLPHSQEAVAHVDRGGQDSHQDCLTFSRFSMRCWTRCCGAHCVVCAVTSVIVRIVVEKFVDCGLRLACSAEPVSVTGVWQQPAGLMDELDSICRRHWPELACLIVVLGTVLTMMVLQPAQPFAQLSSRTWQTRQPRRWQQLRRRPWLRGLNSGWRCLSRCLTTARCLSRFSMDLRLLTEMLGGRDACQGWRLNSSLRPG